MSAVLADAPAAEVAAETVAALVEMLAVADQQAGVVAAVVSEWVTAVVALPVAETQAGAEVAAVTEEMAALAAAILSVVVVVEVGIAVVAGFELETAAVVVAVCAVGEAAELVWGTDVSAIANGFGVVAVVETDIVLVAAATAARA